MSWLLALTGGLAGATLTVGSQWILNWWRRPRLVVTFAESEPGCCVETNADVRTSTGQIVGQAQQRYLRLRVANVGRSSATNVSACITGISHKAPGTGQRHFEEEVCDLRISLSHATIVNLAAGAHRFFDLVHTSIGGPEEGLSFDFDKIPLRLAAQGYGSGSYEFRAFIAAENALSVTHKATWSWDGTFTGLRIQPAS